MPVSPDSLPPSNRTAPPCLICEGRCHFLGLGACLVEGAVHLLTVSPLLFIIAFPFPCISQTYIIIRITWWQKRWLLKFRFLGSLPRSSKLESWGDGPENEYPGSSADQAVWKRVLAGWLICRDWEQELGHPGVLGSALLPNTSWDLGQLHGPWTWGSTFGHWGGCSRCSPSISWTMKDVPKKEELQPSILLSLGAKQ